MKKIRGVVVKSGRIYPRDDLVLTFVHDDVYGDALTIGDGEIGFSVSYDVLMAAIRQERETDG